MNSKRLFHCGGLLLLLAVLMTSCHGMWDEEGQDCTTYKRIYFTYNWNMLFADAFPHEVKTLILYAFNPDGSLAYQKQVSADSVISKGYMDASDLPSGVYTFQVWAEGEDRHPGSYIFGTPNTGTDARFGLTAAITEVASQPAGSVSGTNATAPIGISHDLTPLYYGASGKYGTQENSDFTDMPLGGTRETTINLMKDTENFRIVLADESGKSVDPSAFTFTITDTNGAMDADNNLVVSDTIAYHAWSVQQGDAGEADTLHTGAITGLSSVVAELTTNRLVMGHDMRLHVTRASDGKEIINLPLIDLCLMVKGQYNRNMSDQEYLDRQDTWNLIFFISRENNQQYNWLAASIYVQQWRVVLQNVDM